MAFVQPILELKNYLKFSQGYYSWKHVILSIVISSTDISATVIYFSCKAPVL